ncbi:MAG: T9SS type A sorting domain-containing protein [Crocinitomicaceae bacterium]
MFSLSKKILSFFVMVAPSIFVFGQSEIKQEVEVILSDRSKTFQEITKEVDSIFNTHDYNFVSINLDGAKEKYERWKAFWENHQDENGYLVDFTEHFRNALLQKSFEWCDGVEIGTEWTNLNYNENMGYQIDHGRTTSMAFSQTDINTFYVGSAWGGIWKTTDGGASYTNVNDRLPLAAVSGIYIDPSDEDHLLISLGDNLNGGASSIGIYESTDAGVSFLPTSVDFSLIQNKRIYWLEDNPGNPDILFAATSDGLLRSDDFFDTYSTIQIGSMHCIRFSQSDPNIAYLTGNAGRLFKSTDGGLSFSLITDFGSNVARLDVDDFDADRLVVTCGDQVFYSTDGGTNFTQSTMPESNCVVNLIPGTPNGMVVGNFDTYRSDDGGVNFYPISHWLGNNGLSLIHVDHRNVFTNPYFPDRVYLCNDGGIFRYNHIQDDFTNLSKDLIITQYYDITVSDIDTMVLGGGSQDNGNVTRNSNGTWEAYAGTGDGMEQAIHLSNPNIRFWEYQFGGMRRYDALTGSNTNIEPAAQSTNGAWHTPYKLDPNNVNRIVCGYQRVYESNDMGDTWSFVGSDFTNGASLRQLAIAPSNSDFIYASTNDYLWLKTDVADWAQVTVPPGVSRITEIVVDQDDPNTVYICSSGFIDGQKVFKSVDAGGTWENISYDLPNLPAYSLSSIDSQLGTSESGLFVGTIGSVFYLAEGATNWRKYGCLPATQVSDIEIQYSSEKIFIGTYGRGMFEARLDNFELLSTNEIALDDQLILYPNPASKEVIIQTDLTFTSLVIYDQFSREVKSIDGNTIESVINLEYLSTGVYFFTFSNDVGNVITKKVIVE